MDVTIAVVSAVIATVSAAFSFYHSKKSLDLGQMSHELDRQAHETSERAVALAKLEQEPQKVERIRNWGDDAIESIVRLRRLCETSPSQDAYESRRDEACTRISYQVEQGRLFFPNTLEGAGRSSGGTREGHRQPILDPLVSAYRALVDVPFHRRQEKQEWLVTKQKDFVAALDGIIVPDRPIETYAELLKSYRRT